MVLRLEKEREGGKRNVDDKEPVFPCILEHTPYTILQTPYSILLSAALWFVGLALLKVVVGFRCKATQLGVALRETSFNVSTLLISHSSESGHCIQPMRISWNWIIPVSNLCMLFYNTPDNARQAGRGVISCAHIVP